MIPITPLHYLVLSAALFVIGVVGVMFRRNIIVILMSIELMLNAVNINLVAFSNLWQNAIGQVFVVMLVNLKRPPEAHQDRRRRGRLGVVCAVVVLAELVAIAAYRYVSPAAALPPVRAMGTDNMTLVGTALYQDYLVPFELASMLLLVAMVGAIVLARREL